MRGRRAFGILAAVAALVVTGGAAPGSAAVAAPAARPGLTFRVGGDVRAMAGGAALAVPVSYDCSATRLFGRHFGYAFVTVEVVQTFAGGGGADGFDLGEDVDLTCDGRARSMQVVVFPSGPQAYRAGATAHVSLSVLACDSDEVACIQPSVTAKVPVRVAGPGNPLNQDAGASASVDADGSVTVRVPPGCPPGGFEQVSLELSQRVRGSHVTLVDGGTAFSDPATCGRRSTPVTFATSPFPARSGRAYVVADWTSCDAAAEHCRSGEIRGVVAVA